jgi:multidrug efflux pump subunit AcrA (membrane-fusion protein)
MKLLALLLIIFTANAGAAGFTDTEVEALAKEWHSTQSVVVQRLSAKEAAAAKRDAKAIAKAANALKQAQKKAESAAKKVAIAEAKAAKAHAKTLAQLAKVKRVGNSYSYG